MEQKVSTGPRAEVEDAVQAALPRPRVDEDERRRDEHGQRAALCEGTFAGWKRNGRLR